MDHALMTSGRRIDLLFVVGWTRSDLVLNASSGRHWNLVIDPTLAICSERRRVFVSQ
jgi:hypothetical protein